MMRKEGQGGQVGASGVKGLVRRVPLASNYLNLSWSLKKQKSLFYPWRFVTSRDQAARKQVL